MFRWKAIDDEYQTTVDELAQELLTHPVHDLFSWPDYGTITRSINGADESVGFWHYRFSDDCHHIFFIAQRKTGLIFWRKHISGVVFGVRTDARLMTSEELGDYD